MYVLEELLLADSIEKIIRTEAYLKDVATQASEDEIKIVEYYEKVINVVKGELKISADLLEKYHYGQLNKNTSTTIIKNCQNVYFRVRDFHDEFLSYLPSLKTRTETYTFLKNFLQPIIENEPSIVLADLYNFEEINISQGLIERGIIDVYIKDQIIIGLPKIEKDNPLMWAILVHEIGHYLTDNCLDITKNIIKEGIEDKEISWEYQTTLRNWVKEIVSDLLSIRIMGPSYLCSFIYYNILIEDLDQFTTSHPSPKYRISIMMSILKDEGIDVDFIKKLNNILLERHSRTKELNLTCSDDKCLLCNNDIKPIKDIEIIKKEFCKLVSLSIEKLDETKIEKFTSANLAIAEILVKNLKNFIPINSSKNISNADLKELYNSFNVETSDIYELLEKFEEKPNSVLDIINAGWIHKITNLHSDFIKIFFENNDEGNNSFDEKYANYKNLLHQNDELLLKSLEIADMHLLFESGRDLISS